LGASAKCIISLTHSSLCRACSCLVYTHPDRTQECWWRRTGSMAACRGPSVLRTELPLRTFLLFMSVHAKVHDDDRVPCQFCCSQTCRTIIAHAGTPHSLREGPETHNVTSPGPRPTLRSWSECFLWESGHARIASIFTDSILGQNEVTTFHRPMQPHGAAHKGGSHLCRKHTNSKSF
jgi:hypothetical protein